MAQDGSMAYSRFNFNVETTTTINTDGSRVGNRRIMYQTFEDDRAHILHQRFQVLDGEKTPSSLDGLPQDAGIGLLLSDALSSSSMLDKPWNQIESQFFGGPPSSIDRSIVCDVSTQTDTFPL